MMTWSKIIRVLGALAALAVLMVAAALPATAQDTPYPFLYFVDIFMSAKAEASPNDPNWQQGLMDFRSDESDAPGFDGGTLDISVTNSNEHGSVTSLGRINYAFTETSGFMLYHDELEIRRTDSYLYPGLGGGATSRVKLIAQRRPFTTGDFDVHVVRSDTAPVTYENSLNLNLFYSGPDYHIMWRFNDFPFPGQMPDDPNTSDDGDDPDDGNVDGKVEQHSEPPPAELPDKIAGVNLVPAISAAHTSGPGAVESSYYHYHYFAPVVEDFYGFWDPLLDPTYQNYYPTYFGDPEIVSSAATPATGYLFMNTGGGDFTSFTIPNALAVGDDDFQILFEQQTYDLSVGETFSFAAETGSGEVDSFILTGIDESEMISSAAEVPFAFGLTNSIEGHTHTEFVAIPLVPLAPGDFTGDRLVDGADFLDWQQGHSPNPLSTEDLALWEANFGAASSLDAPLAVPEPSGLLFAVAALTSLVASRRR